MKKNEAEKAKRAEERGEKKNRRNIHNHIKRNETKRKLKGEHFQTNINKSKNAERRQREGTRNHQKNSNKITNERTVQ